jgi:hypothetical protein
MPEVSRFYGIVIQIYYGDHAPPHFHALYAGNVAKVAIDPLEILDGSLPRRAESMVMDWAAAYRTELLEAFARAAALQPPGKIAPLE